MLTKTYKPFSIVAVPFPFTDSPHSKKRPAIVISHEAHQKNTGHVTLVMVTSAKHSAWEDDYLIRDLAAAGLKASSVVRQKIFTLDVRLILECVGKLSEKDKEAVVKQTQKHLKALAPT